MPEHLPYTALVTGGNKGIGFHICRKLCQQLHSAQQQENGVVYVCSRDLDRGREAVKQLETEFPGIPRLLQLDVTDEGSVKRAANIVEQDHAHLDVLVLNAGFAHKVNSTASVGQQFRDTFPVNYYGVRRCLDQLLPFVGARGRVAIVASTSGRMAWDKISPANQEMLRNPSMTVEELDKLAADLLEMADQGTLEAHGWIPSAYGTSKLLVTKLTQIVALQYAPLKPHLLINCCCPGWCKTDMAGYEKPPRTAEEGAETVLQMTTLPDQSTITGKFYSEGSDATYF